MKKIIGILIAMAVIATAGSVAACAVDETVATIPETGTTEKETEKAEETTVQEVNENDETATTAVEASAVENETEVSDATEETESTDHSGGESKQETESSASEVSESGETESEETNSVTEETTDITSAPPNRFLLAIAQKSRTPPIAKPLISIPGTSEKVTPIKPVMKIQTDAKSFTSCVCMSDTEAYRRICKKMMPLRSSIDRPNAISRLDTRRMLMQ